MIFLVAGLFLASCSESNNLADSAPPDAVPQAFDAAVPQIDSGPNACPTATHQCVAEPPTVDWLGPVIRASASLPADPAPCGVAYDTESALVFDGLNATGSCSCSCSGNTAGTACGSATVRGYFSPIGGEGPCSAPISGATDSLPDGGSCSASPLASNSQVSHVWVALGKITTPGTCAETPQVTDTIATATWTTAERFCEVETPIDATCDSGNTCAPLADDGFDDQLCVYRVGVHICVAESAYPETFVRYQDIADQRECGACACNGPVVGSTCPGAVRFGQSAINCSNGAISTGGCISDPYEGTGDGARFQAATTFSCDESGGGVEGIAAGADAITFCCQAMDE